MAKGTYIAAKTTSNEEVLAFISSTKYGKAAPMMRKIHSLVWGNEVQTTEKLAMLLNGCMKDARVRDTLLSKIGAAKEEVKAKEEVVEEEAVEENVEEVNEEVKAYESIEAVYTACSMAVNMKIHGDAFDAFITKEIENFYGGRKTIGDEISNFLECGAAAKAVEMFINAINSMPKQELESPVLENCMQKNDKKEEKEENCIKNMDEYVIGLCSKAVENGDVDAKTSEFGVVLWKALENNGKYLKLMEIVGRDLKESLNRYIGRGGFFWRYLFKSLDFSGFGGGVWGIVAGYNVVTSFVNKLLRSLEIHAARV